MVPASFTPAKRLSFDSNQSPNTANIARIANPIMSTGGVAKRIIRFANLCGRENVIAGADCGFSSQATYKPEVNPKVMWEKFKALSEGARIASKKLWAK